MVPVLLRTNASIGFTENETFDPEQLIYEPSYQASQEHSPVFRQHMLDMLALLRNRFPPSIHIAEIGCGKGAFVAMLEQAGYKNVVGFDPTYEGRASNIRRQYITADDRIDANLIVMRHTLEHIQRPHQFLKMLADISVNQDCAIYIEVPCFDWIRKNEAFFDITYEHLNYFSLRSLEGMFGNKVISSGHVFGGQYIYVIARLANLSTEYAASYNNGDWKREDFAMLFPNVRAKMQDIAVRLGSDRRLYLWGAGTKGCLFLHHAKLAGLLTDRVPFAIDINPGKVGKFMPGSKIGVRSREDFFADANSRDILVVVNPIYLPEIERDLSMNGLELMETLTL
jgi:SAM-dependent methyltransferase